MAWSPPSKKQYPPAAGSHDQKPVTVNGGHGKGPQTQHPSLKK
jgi:hypothetical protein